MPHVIDDSTGNDVLFPKGFGTGHDPAQAEKNDGLLRKATPTEIKLIPRSEWDARYEEQESQKSSLAHIRRRALQGKPMPSLDQNGQGYCWFYSATSAVMIARARDNQPYVRLSAHAGACKIKNFKDEGGWTGLAGDFITKYGVPSVEAWPEKSMSRSNDKPDVWENALQHRVTEDWIDLRQSVYDRNLAEEIVATLLFNNIPVTGDFNWWGHSILQMQWCRIESGSWGPKILNSWTDGWGDLGESILQGNRAKCDGAIGLRTTVASNQ